MKLRNTVKFKTAKDGNSAKLTCEFGEVRLMLGQGVVSHTGDENVLAAEIIACAAREDWAESEGSFTYQLLSWARFIIRVSTLFTVNAVIETMVDVGFCVTHAKEFTHGGQRCLLIQASNRISEDDEDTGGQFYSFIHDGRGWADVSECFGTAQHVVWHLRSESKEAIFYSRSEA